MSKIIGIDLGTTNSVVAIMEGKECFFVNAGCRAWIVIQIGDNVCRFRQRPMREKVLAAGAAPCFALDSGDALSETTDAGKDFADLFTQYVELDFVVLDTLHGLPQK